MKLLAVLLVGCLADDGFSVSSETWKVEPEIELYASPRRRISVVSPRRRVSIGGYSGSGSYGGSAGGHVEITRTSAGDEIASSFVDMLIGILMVTVAFPLLYFNEVRQVKMEQIFTWAEPRITDISADKVDEQYDARPVCVSGSTSTCETLRDGVTNVEVSGCTKLCREVEMYCWIENSYTEERDTADGGKEKITIYQYDQGWSGSPQDGSTMSEYHDNPSMPCHGETRTAKDVRLGAFRLDASLIEQMSKFVPCEVQPCEIDGRALRPSGPGTLESGGGAPVVGDLRITMTKVPCGPASVASIQNGDSFTPLTPDLVPSGGCFGKAADKVDLSRQKLTGDPEINGVCSCVGACVTSGMEMHNLEEVNESGRQLIQHLRAKQNLCHFAVQFLAWAFFVCGFYLIFKFPPSFFRVIPFVGTWIEAGGKFLAAIAGFCVGGLCWCVTLAVSMAATRPVKAAVLLGLALVLLMLPSVLQH